MRLPICGSFDSAPTQSPPETLPAMILLMTVRRSPHLPANIPPPSSASLDAIVTCVSAASLNPVTATAPPYWRTLLLTKAGVRRHNSFLRRNPD